MVQQNKHPLFTEKAFYIIAFILFSLQMFFDTVNMMPLTNQQETLIAAIIMFLSIVNAGFKQFFDPKIPTASIVISILAFCGFVAGGLLDKFDMIPFTEFWQGIIRSLLTFVVQLVPIATRFVAQMEDKER